MRTFDAVKISILGLHLQRLRAIQIIIEIIGRRGSTKCQVNFLAFLNSNFKTSESKVIV